MGISLLYNVELCDVVVSCVEPMWVVNPELDVPIYQQLVDHVRAAVKKEFSLIIGGKTAEMVKINLKELEQESRGAVVYGRDIVTGLPVERDSH